MKKLFRKLNDQAGFTAQGILIALLVVGVAVGTVGLIFKDEIKGAFSKKEEAKTEQSTQTPNPFPEQPKVTATGEWHGRYDVTAPAACAGESGGWEATLTETAGNISGTYSSDAGLSGTVSGAASGGNASWSVGDGSGQVSFNGRIDGNTISGDFTGVSCSGRSNSDRATGTFFGGRIVAE